MHFVLVHGAYHGAWCWDQLRAELERGGHASTAVDLPCDDPDAGAERYVDEVIHAIPKHANAVVLVGHSMAEVTPLRQWPAVPTAYILCAEDRAVSRAYSIQAARRQLGTEPVELPGGHSPFLSRPRVLAQALVRAASR